MTPGLRKLVLTSHVTFSVGWLGAVAGFLALSVASLTSQNAEVVRGAYVSMKIAALVLAALVTVHMVKGGHGFHGH
jgi:hypothetical protein